MRLIGIGPGIKSNGVKSCRWSIGTAFLLYAVLFALVKVFQVPPKSPGDAEGTDEASGDNGKNTFESGNRAQVNDIIDYLHKLHRFKGTQEMSEDEKEIIQPYHNVEEVFHKADYNGDNYLSSGEISKWINAKTQEHIHEAIVENYKTFVMIDVRPKNGLISWDEYHSYFLQKNELTTHNGSDTERDQESKEKIRSRKVQEAIMRNKAAWSESAKTDPDQLNLDEFLSFRHPESSYSSIIFLVDEIYKKFDRDEDEILTEDEFSTFQWDEEYEKPKSLDLEEAERRREFREMVDLNKDGKATRKEMLVRRHDGQVLWPEQIQTYVDPKNPRHAKEEADTLMSLADADGDGRLSLAEIFNKLDLFLGSKMIDTARSFHDEL